MNLIQKTLLVVGAGITIYFIAFAPFYLDVTTTNPRYNPNAKHRIFSGTEPRYTTKQEIDYKKRFSYAMSTMLGAGVLFFVVKSQAKNTEA